MDTSLGVGDAIWPMMRLFLPALVPALDKLFAEYRDLQEDDLFVWAANGLLFNDNALIKDAHVPLKNCKKLPEIDPSKVSQMFMYLNATRHRSEISQRLFTVLMQFRRDSRQRIDQTKDEIIAGKYSDAAIFLIRCAYVIYTFHRQAQRDPNQAGHDPSRAKLNQSQ